MFRHAVLLAALLLMIWRALFGQQDISQRPSQTTSENPAAVPENRTVLQSQDWAKLTARTDLVLVPVIVTDKSGKHVSGLQKEAFGIEENGNVRSVSVFEEAKTEKLVARKDTASDDYFNFLPGDESPWRLTSIVLDMINTPGIRQLEAKKQLIDYLLRSASHDEPIALFGLNGSGLHQLHPFTTDTKVLIAALQRLTIDELERCFAEAVDDSRAYYLLGYYLGGDARPGWRKLKVKVAGDGLRVRYRSGFYFTPKIQDSAELRRKQLVDALASPVQYNGLRLSARFLPPSTDPASTSHTATSDTGKRPAEFMLGVMGDCIAPATRQNRVYERLRKRRSGSMLTPLQHPHLR